MNATHWLTYYVYFETEYTQGSWSRIDILEKSGYKYLAPMAFEGLFGSEDSELVNTMMSKLKEKSPNVYNWTYDLVIQNDTVILSPKGHISRIGTVKNEIISTLILNNFKAVIFNYENIQETYSLEDLTLPFFDLVEVEKKNKIIDKQESASAIDNQNSTEQQQEKYSYLIIGLILSFVLNIGLIILMRVKTRNKSTKHNIG